MPRSGANSLQLRSQLLEGPRAIGLDGGEFAAAETNRVWLCFVKVGFPTTSKFGTMKTKRYRTSPKRAIPAIPARSYETKLDEKKRVVLRGAQHKYYEVQEKANGSILLTPKELVDIEPISKATMKMIESSMANLKKGIVSGPIDLSEFRKPRREKREK
jgi:hypothetical protein